MKWILFLLLLFFCVATMAQKSRNYDIPKFQKLDISEGLSNSNVSSIIQDDLGYIWIATARGINKYDGTSFEQYFHSENENSLYNDMVVKLHKNDNGIIFCSTTHGLNVFDTKKNRMLRIGTEHGSFIDFIDADNKTYGISYISGLCVYNPSKNTFERLPHIANDKLLNNLIADDKTGIWASSINDILTFMPYSASESQKTSNQVLVNYNPKTNSFAKFKLPNMQGEYKDCPIVKIDSLILLKGKVFSTFNINSKDFTPLPKRWGNLNRLNELEIWSIELIDNMLWIGTRNNGLYIFNLETNALINLNKANSDIKSDFIKCIFKDRDKNMWLGSFDRGVNIAYKDRGNVNYNVTLNKITSNKFINSITSDNQNNYYIGSRNDGFYIYNSGTNTYKQFHSKNSFLSSDFIRTIFIDSQQKVWVADQKALHIINQKTKQVKDYYIPEVNEGMAAFCELGDKVIASSDFQGFFIFDFYGNLIKREMRLGSNISEIIPLNQEEILVASYVNGIYRYSLQSGSYKNIYNPMRTEKNNANQTITIYLDSDSILWIGNYMNGLHRLDLKNYSARIYTTRDGLPNNDIVGILEDASGALWLSTSYGISRFNKEKEFVNFFYNEGFENLQFHARSAHIDKNGIIYFGAGYGLSYFDPLVISQTINKQAPKIILESITVQNKKINPDDETGLLSEIVNNTSKIILNHKQNSITIDYHAFDYAAANEIRYCYILDGLEEEWNNVGKRDFASFSNLRPGNYTFKVKAQNNMGIWSEISSLRIAIKPSPFLTIWAFLIYLLMVSTIIYITFQIRLRARLYKTQLESEHNERVRENEVAEMKMRFFTNISHEIRTPLTLIKGYVDLFSKDMEKRNLKINSFNGLQYSTNRLLNLVNQLLLVRKLENDVLELKVKRADIVQLTNRLIQPYLYIASSKEISIDFESDFDKLILPVDEDNYEKIMSNLLSNSLKHVKEKGLIKIKLERLGIPEIATYFNDKSLIKDDSYVKISVIDNGTGIPKEDLEHIFDRYTQSKTDRKKPDYSGTGIGLNFTKRLIELHHGAIMVKSKKNIETIFSFILPLNEAIYEKEVWTNSESTLKPEKYVKETSTITSNKNKPLILLVEDDLELNRFIKSLLTKHFNVISCFNGKEGIRLAKNQLPELIISDIMMPGMDGFELCKNIREDELISHIPIILLTAKTENESKISGYNYGADDYITKPFDHDVLIARIRNLIESRKKLQASYKQGIILESQTEIRNPFELNFIKRIESIVSSEYHSSKLNVNFLASEMNMSRTNFYRKFMSVADISPKDFITKYRINKSIELMKSGNDNFGEISDLCGFGSQSNFSAIFKKEKGVTPLQFKKTL